MSTLNVNNSYNMLAFGQTTMTFSIDGVPLTIKDVSEIENGVVQVNLKYASDRPDGVRLKFKKSSTKSQTEAIKEHLMSGRPITPLEALEMYGCFRLGARIADLKKQGMLIFNDNPRDESTGKRYARYHL